MDQVFAEVSWLGVVVGAVVAFLAGWLWYLNRPGIAGGRLI